MLSTPSAKTTVSSEASPLAGGVGYCVVIAPVSRNADVTPRVFANGRAIQQLHDYAPGVDFSSTFIDDTDLPVIFVGIPIATPGVVSRQNASGMTGTSAVSVSLAGTGALEEVKASVRVLTGGTIGQRGIVLGVSMDDEITTKTVRLGTGNSYTVQFFGITINFAAGTLVEGDVFTFETTAPMWDNDGIAAAKTALCRQKKPSRSWQVIGDVPNATYAGYITAATNSYETSKKRFVYARAQIKDRTPLAAMSRPTVRMQGSPALTFAEVGGTGDTITRNAGSWIDDGFAAGMFFTVSGSVSNNVSDKIVSVTATVITLGSTDLAAEVAAGCTVVASPALTFAEVGGTGDTITRSGGGNFLAEGFAAGDVVTVAGSASNNVTGALTGVTATTLTFGTTDLAAEVIGSRDVTIVKGQTMAEFVSASDQAFETVTSQKRLSLGLGRLTKLSTITGWELRRPVQWAAAIREYQHDVHTPTWQKELGPLDGWGMDDAHGNVVEYDQENDGGAIEARFTCARTWGNGPDGAYIAMDLTRAEEDDPLVFTHNIAVANVACTIIQKQTENFVGKIVQLKDDGTGVTTSLTVLEEKVNSALKIGLLQQFFPSEGQRASSAKWKADPSSILRGTDASLLGAGKLDVNGTIVHVDTDLAVR